MQVRQPLDLGNLNTEEGTISISPTWGESFSAAFKLSMNDQPIMSVSRIMAKRELEGRGGRQITPDELNQMYPDMEEKFTKPTSKLVADYLYEQQQQRQALQRRASGIGGVSQFIAGMAGSLADPVNLAAGYAVGAVLAPIKGYQAIKAALSNKIGAPATRVLTGAAENLIDNTATEALTFQAAKAEQQTYTLTDAAFNVGVGSIAFPMFREGVSQAARLVSRNFPKVEIQAKEVALDQLVNDKRVEIDPIIDSTVKKVRIDTPEMDYKPMDISTPIRGEFLAVSRTSGLDLKATDTIGEDWGDFFYVTPSKAHADLYVQGDMPGTIISVGVEDAKFLDVEDTLPKDVVKIVSEVSKKQADGTSLRDIMSDLSAEDKNNIMNKLGIALKEAGYDGLRFDGSKATGGSSYDTLMLFDSDKARVRGVTRGNRVDTTDSPEIAKHLVEHKINKSGNVDYDVEIESTAKRLDADPMIRAPIKQEVSEFDLELKDLEIEVREQMDLAKSLGEDLSDYDRLLTDIDNLKEVHKSEDTIFKAAITCVGKV